MANLVQWPGSRTSLNLFCAGSCLFLLLLSAVTWLLPLTPAVQTLDFKPPLFFSEAAHKKPAGNLSESEQIMKDVLEAAGCDKGYYSYIDPYKDCQRLEKVLLEAYSDEDENEQSESYVAKKPDIMPELKADCWCPAQFESAHIVYTNTICANQMNYAIRGMDGKTDVHISVTFDPEEEDIKFDKLVKNITQKEVYLNRSTVIDNYNALITRRSYFILFVFALLLVVPSLIWEMLSSVSSRLNIDKTLNTLRFAQTQTADSGRRTCEEVAREALAAASCSGKTAKLFLLCMISACCIAVGLVLFITIGLQPQLTTLAGELEELSKISKLSYFKNQFFFSCHFRIRQLTNVHNYDVNCLTSIASSVGPGAGPKIQGGNGGAYALFDQANDTVVLYEGLFSIASSALILYATVCFFLTAKCVITLYSGDGFSSTALGKEGCMRKVQFPEDIRLFLYMAHEQLGLVVYQDLITSFLQASTCDSIKISGFAESGDKDFGDNV
ncbi:pannexin 7 [Plakobranchus ocellatus]|uniref:Pannexin 7 n=1 Tax=Plakobranchus ocellatus TaxID=259542 RepID=A0AAV3Z488_9GAST|nr:pannexin 7 [Plakobranchus ocellatus]